MNLVLHNKRENRKLWDHILIVLQKLVPSKKFSGSGTTSRESSRIWYGISEPLCQFWSFCHGISMPPVSCQLSVTAFRCPLPILNSRSRFFLRVTKVSARVRGNLLVTEITKSDEQKSVHPVPLLCPCKSVHAVPLLCPCKSVHAVPLLCPYKSVHAVPTFVPVQKCARCPAFVPVQKCARCPTFVAVEFCNIGPQKSWAWPRVENWHGASKWRDREPRTDRGHRNAVTESCELAEASEMPYQNSSRVQNSYTFLNGVYDLLLFTNIWFQKHQFPHNDRKVVPKFTIFTFIVQNLVHVPQRRVKNP